MCFFFKAINFRIMFLLSPERFSFSLFSFSSSLLMIGLLKADSWRLLSELSGFTSLQFLRLQHQHPYSASPEWSCAALPGPSAIPECRLVRDHDPSRCKWCLSNTQESASVLVSGDSPDVSLVTFDLPVGNNGSQPWLQIGFIWRAA